MTILVSLFLFLIAIVSMVRIKAHLQDLLDESKLRTAAETASLRRWVYFRIVVAGLQWPEMIAMFFTRKQT